MHRDGGFLIILKNEKRRARWKPYKNSLAHKVLSDVSNQNEFFFLFAERRISPFFGGFRCSESERGVACPSPADNDKPVLDRAMPKTCQFFLDILPFKASEKCSAFTRFCFDSVNLEHTGISLIGEAVKRFQETPLHQVLLETISHQLIVRLMTEFVYLRESSCCAIASGYQPLPPSPKCYSLIGKIEPAHIYVSLRNRLFELVPRALFTNTGVFISAQVSQIHIILPYSLSAQGRLAHRSQSCPFGGSLLYLSSDIIPYFLIGGACW